MIFPKLLSGFYPGARIKLLNLGTVSTIKSFPAKRRKDGSWYVRLNDGRLCGIYHSKYLWKNEIKLL